MQILHEPTHQLSVPNQAVFKKSGGGVVVQCIAKKVGISLDVMAVKLLFFELLQDLLCTSPSALLWCGGRFRKEQRPSLPSPAKEKYEPCTIDCCLVPSQS